MNIRANATFRAGEFARMEALLVPRLVSAAENASKAVLQISQGLAPSRSGNLKASGGTEVEWKHRAVTGYIVYRAEYTSFVEFGTGVIGRGTYPYTLPQEGVPITGSWIYDYKSQNWPGMTAQPFIRPSLDIGRNQILECFRVALSV